jgi:hypothetical protein
MRFTLVVLSGLAAAFAGCGGGGSGTPAAQSTTVAGSVYAAPVSGASVTVRNAAGAVVAGPATTTGAGAFSIEIPTSALAGALRFESAGGAFTDEATGSPAVGGRLAAWVEAGSLAAGSGVHLTPMSTLTHDLVVSAGKSAAVARAACTATFGFCDNVAVGPVNDNAVSGSDNVARRLCALRAAAFSRLAYDLGLPADNQFALVAALADDLSDDTLDGRNGTDNVDMAPGVALPEDVRNRFARALTAMWGSAANRTGLTADQIGAPPSSDLALTATYRVAYVPVTSAVQGRTDFVIRVTRRDDNTAVTGLAASGDFRIVPWMYMSTKSHSSPIDNAVVESAPGEYSCSVYYVMSSMMGSSSMGFWELKVQLSPTEFALFHPVVAMPSGYTARVTLKGVADNAASVPVAPRSYFLFRDGAPSGTTGNHTFNVYLAAYDNQSTFPQLQVGTMLRDPAGTPWAVTSVSLEASTDNTFATGVVTGVNGSGAHWSFPGLTGLTSGAAGHVYVRLVVNGEEKTVDGLADSGTNGFGDFALTAP